MLIKTKVSFFYYYEEEKITGTYLEVRHPFDLVLHNNLDFVIILSNFDIKTPVKDLHKRSIKTSKLLYAYPCNHIFVTRSTLFCCIIFSLIA